jgi:hypothetical protein
MAQTPRTPISAKELLAAAAFTLLAALALASYGYRDTLSEFDLYAATLGLWDGAVSGRGLDSPVHYYVWLSFGWIEFVNRLAPHGVLDDASTIIPFINAVGFYATLAIPALMWLALRLLYSAACATAATLLFVLSPIFLEVAGSAHPLLPSLAFFLLAAIAMFAPLDGWRRALAWSAAAALLALSLLLRFELAFAFPFLVLAQVRTTTLRDFIVSGLRRSIPGAVAIIAYFSAQVALVGSHSAQSTGSFLGEWYSLANVGTGVAAAALALGMALSALAAATAAREALAARAIARGFVVWFSQRAHFMAPAAIILAALLFWLPNPLPARHFLLFAFGVSAFVALALHHTWRFKDAYLVAAALGVAFLNQAAAFATAPVVARLSPSELQAPIGVLLPAPAEPAWIRRDILKARGEAARALGRRIVDDACADTLVVLSDQSPALLTAFLREGRRPDLRLIGAYPGAYRYQLREAGRSVDFIQRREPRFDALSAVMIDADYIDAAIFIDPMTRQRTDILDPPPDRVETLHCGVRGATP